MYSFLGFRLNKSDVIITSIFISTLKNGKIDLSLDECDPNTITATVMFFNVINVNYIALIGNLGIWELFGDDNVYEEIVKGSSDHHFLDILLASYTDNIFKGRDQINKYLLEFSSESMTRELIMDMDVDIIRDLTIASGGTPSQGIFKGKILFVSDVKSKL